MGHRITLEWKDLEYSVPVKDNKFFDLFKWCRKIEHVDVLKRVSGSLESGNLVAILGPSGAGKTTLLAAISQRIRGNLKGSLTLDGIPIDRDEMAKISCFLPQYEISIKTLTAFEHLFFMCHFKMDSRVSKGEKIQKVNDLLEKVGLSHTTTTRIANMSGGERKRLNLAEEMIRDPMFIFCDEPTTGLDSYSAFSVIKTLRQLTRPQHNKQPADMFVSNIEMQIISPEKSWEDMSTSRPSQKGIICSIHQPTSDVFELFSHIILVSAGRVIYQGSSDGALLFFSNLGLSCPRNCNPADFYIRILADDKNTRQFREIIRNNFEQEIIQRKPLKSVSLESLQDTRQFKQISWISQVFYLLVRTSIQTKRELKDIAMKMSLVLIVGLIMSIIYLNVTGQTQSSIQDIQGFMFMFSTEMVFSSSYGVIYEFPSNLPIIRREVGENLYSISAYYSAQILQQVPYSVIISFLFLGIIYAITNFAAGIWSYLSMGVTLSLTALTASSYGYFLSSLFESTKLACAISTPFDLFFLIFGGYYMTANTSILRYLSMFFYCNEALAYEYWHNVDEIACPENTTLPCLHNGTEVLEKFSFSSKDSTLLEDYYGLTAIFLAMNIIAFVQIFRYVRRTGYY